MSKARPDDYIQRATSAMALGDASIRLGRWQQDFAADITNPSVPDAEWLRQRADELRRISATFHLEVKKPARKLAAEIEAVADNPTGAAITELSMKLTAFGLTVSDRAFATAREFGG